MNILILLPLLTLCVLCEARRHKCLSPDHIKNITFYINHARMENYTWPASVCSCDIDDEDCRCNLPSRYDFPWIPVTWIFHGVCTEQNNTRDYGWFFEMQALAAEIQPRITVGVDWSCDYHMPTTVEHVDLIADYFIKKYSDSLHHSECWGITYGSIVCNVLSRRTGPHYDPTIFRLVALDAVDYDGLHRRLAPNYWYKDSMDAYYTVAFNTGPVSDTIKEMDLVVMADSPHNNVSAKDIWLRMLDSSQPVMCLNYTGGIFTKRHALKWFNYNVDMLHGYGYTNVSNNGTPVDCVYHIPVPTTIRPTTTPRRTPKPTRPFDLDTEFMQNWIGGFVILMSFVFFLFVVVLLCPERKTPMFNYTHNTRPVPYIYRRQVAAEAAAAAPAAPDPPQV
ncbi:membrane protein ORF138 [Cyprinid herpesvirus 3]|uniref:Membrane protein ORF138 n=1 Tax=Cyprinid herpesvirus 3 TaxID=180230 RepID=A3QMV4_CYHV3|nr:unnamed protein product [Cyprinid herpesvirus 3]ABC55107.1 hypothetical protein [Cyprinid herpesvirus 3]ABG42965.1 membrane protein ORF138 [Cyprinid herpesvirus 3]AIC32493.1 ORF138L [Cyprinid herpesvirus 3]AJP55625.1 membrane protein ORF138 [Cyprinid herpesvirus 3]AJP55780.1 membrane protein ORF138 [Cyprinid herpesvirus 3]